MFAIHTDNIDMQKRLASSIHQPRGLPAGKHEMQFPAKQPAQQMPRRALADVSNQRGPSLQHGNQGQKAQKPLSQSQVNRQVQQGQGQQMLSATGAQQQQVAPNWAAQHVRPQAGQAQMHQHQQHKIGLAGQQLHEDHLKEQVYLREQAMAQEAARSRAHAAAQQMAAQQQQQQQQMQMMEQEQQWMQQQPPQIMFSVMHTPTPSRRRKKKRTAKRMPVAANYQPPFSPVVENILGELPTPARLAYLNASVTNSPPPKGILGFAGERLVNDENAVPGQRVVIASQFGHVAFFKKYVGRTGVLMRKSEAPGGCGWIVDFGPELGRQFFSTGGAGGVCHLAFAPPPQTGVEARQSSCSISPNVCSGGAGWSIDPVPEKSAPPVRAWPEPSKASKLDIPAANAPAPQLLAARSPENAGLMKAVAGGAGAEVRSPTSMQDDTAQLSARIQSELQRGSLLSYRISEQVGRMGINCHAGGGAASLSAGAPATADDLVVSPGVEVEESDIDAAFAAVKAAYDSVKDSAKEFGLRVCVSHKTTAPQHPSGEIDRAEVPPQAPPLSAPGSPATLGAVHRAPSITPTTVTSPTMARAEARALVASPPTEDSGQLHMMGYELQAGVDVTHHQVPASDTEALPPRPQHAAMHGTATAPGQVKPKPGQALVLAPHLRTVNNTHPAPPLRAPLIAGSTGPAIYQRAIAPAAARGSVSSADASAHKSQLWKEYFTGTASGAAGDQT